ncbi:MAG: cbb3-type cytochrome oxidase assembly protein [Myxococcota bacterium]
MEVLILLVFVSTVLVAGAVAFFVWNVRQGTHEFAERLALLPLEEEGGGGTRDAIRRGGGDPPAPEDGGSGVAANR